MPTEKYVKYGLLGLGALAFASSSADGTNGSGGDSPNDGSGGDSPNDGTDDGSNGDTGGGTPSVSADVEYGVSSGTLELDGSGSRSPNTSIVSYAWTVERDGNRIAQPTGATPSLQLPGDGQYAVALTVTGETGISDTKTESFFYAPTDDNQPPTADMNVSIDAAGVVNYDGTPSSDNDGRVVGYAWEIRDMTGATVHNGSGIGGTADLSDRPGGTYAVDLVVTDDDGATDGDVKTIEWSGSGDASTAPDASVTASMNDTLGVLSFDGSASSDANGRIVEYEWTVVGPTGSVVYGPVTNVGDSGSTVVDQAGDYTVSLVVTDNDGETDSATATATRS